MKQSNVELIASTAIVTSVVVTLVVSILFQSGYSSLVLPWSNGGGGIESMTRDDIIQHLEIQIAGLHKQLGLWEKMEAKRRQEDDDAELERAKAANEQPDARLEGVEYFLESFGNEPRNPVTWHGEDGREVVVPRDLQAEVDRRFKENNFNVVASDLIALNRSIPEQRSHRCQTREYPVDLPTTSIIIVHHNEANTTLLRTLVSLVRKTPLRYLKEIILVDDKSVDRAYLGKPLDDFAKTMPVPVIVMRNEVRMGLTRSRLRGAEVATGDTMTFLDAHIEASNGWLTPLLYEIKKNRRAVPCPVIDIIHYDHFSYTPATDHSYGGFGENLQFRWNEIPKRELFRRKGDSSLPARTPTMAGGLFTIDRTYFYEMGSYDQGMDIWGGENIEMSFRIWMCGGTILFVPCSHVGHVFRKSSPYSFPGGEVNVIAKNNRRVVDVWTDEYAPFFYQVIQGVATVDAGDMSERIQLRKDLQCKSFAWYLRNIYPEAPLPINYYHVGEIRSNELNFCLDTLSRGTNKDVGASFCHLQGGNQVFQYTKTRLLKKGALCLDSRARQGSVKMPKCDPTLPRSQQWDYDNVNEYFRNRETSACLTISEKNNQFVVSKSCDPNDPLQKFSFTNSIFPLANVSIQNDETKLCLDTIDRSMGEDIGAGPCHWLGLNQAFQYTKSQRLVVHGVLCLDTLGTNGPVKFVQCLRQVESQIWHYDYLNKQFVTQNKTSCLTLNEKEPSFVLTTGCDEENRYQKWTFNPTLKKYDERNIFIY